MSAGPSQAALSIRNLRFRWPGAAQDTLAIEAFDVAPGESVFLHGPSGSGKSTLLSLMAGVLLPTQGQVSVAGQDWGELRASRRDAWRADHVGYVFQQFNLLPYLSVLDNVTLPCRLSSARRHRAEQAGGVRSGAQRWLSQLGLSEALWRKPVTDLSVGQQQRVAAARALMGSPNVIIADEPTSALDERWRDEFLNQTLQACRQAGSALVVVSHDHEMSVAFDRCHDFSELNAVPSITEARA